MEEAVVGLTLDPEYKIDKILKSHILGGRGLLD